MLCLKCVFKTQDKNDKLLYKFPLTLLNILLNYILSTKIVFSIKFITS